eukprot:2672644-Rhodomonas_salina.2
MNRNQVLQTTADPDKNGMCVNISKFRVVPSLGLLFIVTACNQQLEDQYMLWRLRVEDLSSVFTVLPASGPDNDIVSSKPSTSKKRQRVLWDNQHKKKRARTSTSAKMGPKDREKAAAFFSMAPMAMQLGCLQQLAGLHAWNVALHANFVLKELWSMILNQAKQLLSDLKTGHAASMYDLLIFMAGLVPTVMFHMYQALSKTGKQSTATCKDTINIMHHLQREDALH